MWAAGNNRVDALELLVRHGAYLNIKNNVSKTCVSDVVFVDCSDVRGVWRVW